MPGDAADWLRAWDSQGFHRTGTDGDEAGAAWLAREAAALGAAVTSEAFALDRIDPVDVCLELDDGRIDAVPVFDAPATGPDGVSGTLGPAGSDAAIGVAELSPQAVYSGEYHALRRNVVASRAGHRVPRCASRPGPAERRAVPCAVRRAGDPCSERGARGGARRRCTRQHGAAGRRIIGARRRPPATSSSTIAGRDRARPPVVVMTPRSSWWQSTAERGGGLVCWLRSLRALLAASAGDGRRADRQQRTRTGPSRARRRSSRGGRAGSAMRSGCIGAPISALPAARLTVMSANDELRALAAARAGACGPAAGCARARNAGAEWRDARHPSGRRTLCHAGRQQSAGSICRRTAGRMRLTWPRWSGSPQPRRGWWWR